MTHGETKVKIKDEGGTRSRVHYFVMKVSKYLCQKTTWVSSGYNMAYNKEVGRKIMESTKYLGLRYYEDTYLAFKLSRIPGVKKYVPKAEVITAFRRVKSESLKRRYFLWTRAMAYYVLFREFPGWAYKKEYAAYR